MSHRPVSPNNTIDWALQFGPLMHQPAAFQIFVDATVHTHKHMLLELLKYVTRFVDDLMIFKSISCGGSAVCSIGRASSVVACSTCSLWDLIHFSHHIHTSQQLPVGG